MKIKITDIGEKFIKEDILYIKLNDKAVINYTTAKELLDLENPFLNDGELKPVLVDLSNIRSMSSEARDLVTSEEVTKNVSKIALIRKSHMSNLISNFFLGLNKSPKPTKIFSDEKKAIEWLKS